VVLDLMSLQFKVVAVVFLVLLAMQLQTYFNLLNRQ
jgi:hypothetical protein